MVPEARKKGGACTIPPISYDTGRFLSNRDSPRSTICIQAKVTQLVECNLAKVDVAGSNPVFRSASPVLPGFFSLGMGSGTTRKNIGFVNPRPECPRQLGQILGQITVPPDSGKCAQSSGTPPENSCPRCNKGRGPRLGKHPELAETPLNPVSAGQSHGTNTTCLSIGHRGPTERRHPDNCADPWPATNQTHRPLQVGIAGPRDESRCNRVGSALSACAHRAPRLGGRHRSRRSRCAIPAPAPD